MQTYQEFKTAHNLSDSAFKRLCQKASEGLGYKVTQRIGSKTWAFTNEIAFAKVTELATDRPAKVTDRPAKVTDRTSKVTDQKTEIVEAEIIPASEIDIFSSNKLVRRNPYENIQALADFHQPAPLVFDAQSTASEVAALQLSYLNSLQRGMDTDDQLTQARLKAAAERGAAMAQREIQIEQAAYQATRERSQSFFAQSQGLSEVGNS